jgi:hypothetical protein
VTGPETTPTVGEPITNGLRTVNFFNGRLLSAEDLRREQDANKALRDRLGLAVGDGVVSGLEVGRPLGGKPADAVITVSAGVAVNREGTALRLPRDTVVSLAGRRRAAPPAPARGSAFAACSGLGDGAPFTTSGVYLLTVSPSGAPVGRAPVSGLGNEAAACNTDGCADGVEFRLVHLGLPAALFSDAALPFLRNTVAHLMFGTLTVSGAADPRSTRLERDPFGTPAGPYGLLDDLRDAGVLRDAEVPLACLHWVPGPGIRFIDMWSVRRGLTRRAADPMWPEVTGERRPAEGEAMFLQFQDEIDAQRSTAGPEQIVATEHFRFLPAAGLLPLASGNRRGYSFRTFFRGLPFRDPVVIEPAHLPDLLRQSVAFPPIDLQRQEAVWLYTVRENLTTPSAGRVPQTFVVFTSGHLPYRGDARFDLAYWNLANFARVG